MENLLTVSILFIWGTLSGSFLNVLIDRCSTNRSAVKGRSYCENCKKPLSWHELMPLLSFAIQRGKCNHCRAKIPPRLFLVELLIGFLFPYLYIYGQGQQMSLISLFFVGIVLYSFIGIFFNSALLFIIFTNFSLVILLAF